MPLIGGFSFGLVLSAILELCKLAGLDEKYAGAVSLAVGLAWTGVAYFVGMVPAYQNWAVWAIQLILVVCSVPLGSKTAYSAIVKPIAMKRWNHDAP
jgi:hypothetical protein